MTQYRDTKDFSQAELASLFSSVAWESARFPERLVRAMKGFQTVFSAWEGDGLLGLIAVLDDGEMTAYIHYLLVRPEAQRRGIGSALLAMALENTGRTPGSCSMPRAAPLPFTRSSALPAWTPFPCCGAGCPADAAPIVYIIYMVLRGSIARIFRPVGQPRPMRETCSARAPVGQLRGGVCVPAVRPERGHPRLFCKRSVRKGSAGARRPVRRDARS